MKNLVTLGATILLAGCVSTTSARLPANPPVTGKDVFAAIACELKEAVDEQPELSNWSAAVSVSFSDASDVIVIPNASWSANLGATKITSTSFVSSETSSTNLLPLTKTYNQLGDPEKGPAHDCGASVPPHGLDVRNALLEQFAWKNGTPVDVVLDKEVKTAGYTRSFAVIREADGSLSFSIGPVAIKADGSKAILKGINTLTLVFGFPAGGKDAVTNLRDFQKKQAATTALYDAITEAVAPGTAATQ